MRYVELRRHTDNEGDRPGRAAPALCRVRVHRRGPRHPDAGNLAARGRPGRHPDHRGDGAAVLGGESLARRGQGSGQAADLKDIRAIDPDLVERESRLLGSALRQVVAGLPEGGRALVAGHSPTTEAAVLGLAGLVVPPLGKGNGVLLVQDGGDYQVEPLD